jgi:RsiW-degrading membrane proteinase PrsW (M82 family)
VGLCEEICKAMPLLYRYNSEALGSWRVACMCGLASGAGFGVSEAIQYSSHFYNGVAGADLYWIRFISCVGLHALWTGGGAIMLFKRRDLLEGNSGWNFFFMVVALLSAPIVLHGLYDTLLKKEMQSWALLVAVATFGWFCWQVETTSRKFAGMEEDMAAAG